jgi:hypothetical protein
MGEGGNDTEPVERMEEFFDTYNRLERFEHEKDGDLVEEKYDYYYTTQITEYTYKDYTENPAVAKRVTMSYSDVEKSRLARIDIKEGTALVEYTEYEYEGYYAYTGYSTYTVAGETETLKEKQDNYEVEGTTVSYDISRFE